MTELYHILADLNERRRQLGMSESVVAQRAGISPSTAHRTLAGRENPGYRAVEAIANALVAPLWRKPEDIALTLEKQAAAKAEKLVRLVQGSSALEGQAVDKVTRRQMVQRTKAELLAGPRRRLWATR